ncbi:alpha/beta hydrolase [Streptomyces sp. NPDC052676]|uniref:alpha/beta fold hydrolase n=1 Tax=Streptomyces sp. NPDC052676 TaxID=3154953 RepID=UPI003419EB1E
MTAVFVHGVPETEEIWRELRDHLDVYSVALTLPGFGGSPAPEYTDKEAYADWLAAELAGVPGPVDLVGHDWGALLTYRVATARDVPLRSWAADCAGLLHPDYVWHDVARIWQTPGEGEAFNERLRAAVADDPTSVAGRLRGLGVPARHALAMQKAFDAPMGEAILRLYRSAVPNPYAHWGKEFERATAAPGLVLSPAGDPFDDAAAARAVAARLGARVATLPDAGHFWMLEDPAGAARVLSEFWSASGPFRGASAGPR